MTVVKIQTTHLFEGCSRADLNQITSRFYFFFISLKKNFIEMARYCWKIVQIDFMSGLPVGLFVCMFVI